MRFAFLAACFAASTSAVQLHGVKESDTVSEALRYVQEGINEAIDENQGVQDELRRGI